MKRVIVAVVSFLAVANALEVPPPMPAYALPDMKCGDLIAKLPPLAMDTCEGKPAYNELGSCAPFMANNATYPSAECCTSLHSYRANSPGCLCKSTFQSKLPGNGPTLARALPLLCNITDDLCESCPSYFGPLRGNLSAVDCASSLKAKYKLPSDDPCQSTNAYNVLGTCGTFMGGNVSSPSAECCMGIQEVWRQWPGCFCKVTFFSKFPHPEDVRALWRPTLCNMTADICQICPTFLDDKNARRAKTETVAAVIATSILAALLLIGCVVVVCCRKRVFRRHYENKEYQQQCSEINNIEGKPTIFPYHVLKHATKNFNPDCKLGEGGFGSVFKGVLPDGMEVAVKKLSAKSQQGNDEFLNEVTLITSVQHRNLVKLRGCCLKADERLLVYEYLENKSLHQALFDKPRLQMDWPTRMRILEGTARGLAYLHEGCNTRIVHRDVKASNILLDRDLNPKIADFGLARIFSENDTHVSTRVAGTAGYLAPEYAMRGQLTEKADVFSYGIVVLELVSGRGNLDLHLEPHAVYLLDWAWQLYEEDKVTDLLDPSITWSPQTTSECVRVVEMALLCTHSRTAVRPSMTAVVSILTTGSEVVVPKVGRSDVRNHAELDLKFSGSASSKLTDDSYKSRSYSSQGGNSACSNNNSSVISVLEPR